MKRNLKKLLSVILAAAMLVSVLSLSAFAAEPGGGGEPGGAPGGGGGGGGGQGSSAITLTGMLSLKQYVFVGSENADGTVTTDYYGVYAKGGEGQAAFVPDTSYAGTVAAYLDGDMSVPAAGVEVKLSGTAFTMTGVATSGNVVYYLSTGDGAYATTIYVVNDEYDKNAATLTLADGTTVELTTYAPNMANGDYTATVDAVNAQGAVYVGGNRTIRTAADYGITGDGAAAVNWFLSSGITNAGYSLTEFGEVMYGFEYAVALYRMFQIVIEENLLYKDFNYPTDSQGGMGVNDQYSDAVDAVIQAGLLNGIYTKNSTLTNKGGVPLIENLNDATTFGATEAVDAEFALVTLHNAFTSRWTMLSEAGRTLAKSFTAETNADKMTEIANALHITLPENGELSKIDVVKVLYAASEYVQSKTSPDETWVEQTGSTYSGMVQFYNGEFYKTPVITSTSDSIPDSLITNGGSALLVNNAGTINIHNKTISLVGNSDNAANYVVAEKDENVMIDGMEAAMGTSDVGFVYNATMRNAFYREGIGSAIAIWGKNSVVNLTSDNGTLVLDGEASGSSQMAGTMAGTAYVGFGASLNVTNAVAYSSSQHLTNILYNGNVHFKDAAAFGSGRVYSSDFWGGYQVFEDSIATGGSVTDEPTTLVVKNSVYANSVGGNGFASQYFENSILNVGTASFQNTTSLITDTGALTLVNSKLNSTSATLVSSTKGERVIVTLVDSDIDMSKGNVLAKVDNYTTLNKIREGLSDSGMFDGEVVIDLYGENTIITSDGTLTANVATGASLTINGSVVDEDGNPITIPGAIINPGSGKLIVKGVKMTYGDGADLIASLMKDSGVAIYASDNVFAAMQEAGLIEETVSADDSISGAQFDALLAAALNVQSLDGIGEFVASEKAVITLADAEATINSVVLWAKNGANLTGDTNKFLCIEDGSTWTPDSKSGNLHVAGIIGYGTIAGIRAYGEKSYNLTTKTYNGLTIYYNPYAGSANIVMPSDPRSYEMCYVEGGARLYPDYPAILETLITSGAYTTESVDGENILIKTEDGKTAAVYNKGGVITVSNATIKSSTAFSADLMNISTLGQGDAVIAATEDAVINIKDTTINSLTGRGATALAGATLNIDGATITNRDGSGSHGVCVLYGSIIDIKNSTIDANTSALSSDFGGGLIIADNVKAYAEERGGGILADGMTFGYVTNSILKTAHDAAASTAGCGVLNIDSSVLEGNDKAVLYSYVFGMLASERGEFNVSNSQMSGNSHGIYIQGNTLDMHLTNNTLTYGVGAADTVYLIKAENPTVPAPFYTRANLYFEDMDLNGDIYFDATTDGPCVKGYTETYLNIYLGENTTWTGRVVSTGSDGGVHIFRLNSVTGAYEEVSYSMDTTMTITTVDSGVVVPPSPVQPSQPTTPSQPSQPTEPTQPTTPSVNFVDVPAGAWYADEVAYVVNKGLFSGTSATTFEPNTTMNRAMLATVLHRLAGTPAASSCTFTDVANGQWYTDGIAWAAAKGVVKGYSDTTFGPMDDVTREQMITMLYRYAVSAGYVVGGSKDTNVLSYTDAESISEYAVEAMQWAVGTGILQGDGSALNPRATATRAEVSAILMRFCQLYNV